MEDLKKIIKKDPRYENFTVVEDPIPFKEMFKDKNIETVQVHESCLYDGEHMVGFCGVFSWKKNILIPGDGDSYNPNMLVLGYEWFNENGLDILVGNDW